MELQQLVIDEMSIQKKGKTTHRIHKFSDIHIAIQKWQYRIYEEYDRICIKSQRHGTVPDSIYVPKDGTSPLAMKNKNRPQKE